VVGNTNPFEISRSIPDSVRRNVRGHDSSELALVIQVGGLADDMGGLCGEICRRATEILARDFWIRWQRQGWER
jgi:hypothetical protein